MQAHTGLSLFLFDVRELKNEALSGIEEIRSIILPTLVTFNEA